MPFGEEKKPGWVMTRKGLISTERHQEIERLRDEARKRGKNRRKNKAARAMRKKQRRG